MVDRPTIADLALKAGVSVATVDRVLNRRLPVRGDTVVRVVEAAEAIGYHATGLLKRRMSETPLRKLGFLLQKPDAFYSEFARDLAAATKSSKLIDGKPTIDFMQELEPALIAEKIKTAAARVDALAIVAMDHPLVNEAVDWVVNTKRKPVFTLLSNIATPSVTAHLGLDSRRNGRIAGWTFSHLAHKPGKIGILVGSHRYLNQELSEISFRTYMREHAPKFQLLEPIINLDDENLTYEAVLKMSAENHDLVGVYVAGGGMEGLIKALREIQPPRKLWAICNELTSATRLALRDEIIDLALATPIAEIAKRTVELMIKACNMPEIPHFPQVLLPPDIYLSENI